MLLRSASRGALCGARRPSLTRAPLRRLPSSSSTLRAAAAPLSIPGAPAVKPEKDVPGMSTFLDSLKYADGLVAVIVQVRDGAGSA